MHNYRIDSLSSLVIVKESGYTLSECTWAENGLDGVSTSPFSHCFRDVRGIYGGEQINIVGSRVLTACSLSRCSRLGNRIGSW